MLNPKNDDAEKYNTVTYKNSRLPIRKSTSFWSDVVHLFLHCWQVVRFCYL